MVLVTGLLLVVTTLLVALLEGVGNVPDASSAFLLAVIASAATFGAGAAIGAALGAFLIYDFFYIEPTLTFTVSNTGEWLNLLLFLLVGIVVAQLTGALRDRADAAHAREREALALFRVSRSLATRTSTRNVLPDIASALRSEAGMERVWVVLDSGRDPEHVVADTDPGRRPSPPANQAILHRAPGEAPARWVRVHQPAGPMARGDPDAGYRVRIEVGGHVLGAIWGLRSRAAGMPDASATRLLSAAADQIGQALEQDRLADEARDAEVARQSDALKSALLESVSHDLRTPLATIRAAAGILLDREVLLSDDDRIASAETIDREAEDLNRLVTNLLDLSRIEGGALRAELEAYELDDLVDRTLERLRGRLPARPLDVEIAPDLPPVLVDPVLFDQVLVNLIENELRYVPEGAPIAIDAIRADGYLRLTVEDGGNGVPPEAMGHLFEKFFRVRRRGEPSRPGSGIGLAIVRGLTEAMGGRVGARKSELGGLAIDVDLPLAPSSSPTSPPAPAPDAPRATVPASPAAGEPPVVRA